MEKPVKTIFTFKNDLNIVQHFLYIFIGDVPKILRTVLNKIKDTDLLESLIVINKNDIKLLESYYGKHWYKYLFPIEHIKYVKNNLSNPKYNKLKYKAIKKVGKQWFNNHFQIGGEEEEEEKTLLEEYLKNPYEDDVDEDIKENKKEDLIFKKAIEKHKDNISKIRITPFNKSKNNIHKESNLKKLFEKIYITSLYILPDDTIKTIKKKICITIKNDERYGYLIPSRIYLWSEVYKKGVMLGHKWMEKEQVWDDIMVLPKNNIEDYYNLDEYALMIKRKKAIISNFIHIEDDEDLILHDYVINNLVKNNEIFFTDIYHEIGKNIVLNQEQKENLYQTFTEIYFPKVKKIDVTQILDFLNDKNVDKEITKQNLVYNDIVKEILLENQSIEIYHKTKETDVNRYSKYLTNLYISSLNATWLNDNELDLYSIFDTFELSERYPFMQLQLLSNQYVIKIYKPFVTNTSKEQKEIIKKWFITTPYGISFKIRLNDPKYPFKFITVNINSKGKVEYKSQWRISESANLEYIKGTINEVITLIRKINKYNDDKLRLKIPHIKDFKIVFINAMQHFEIPINKSINHNDLTDFSRLFFPFITIITIPPKRKGDKYSTSAGKYGTYLTYKRISKYEQNQVLLIEKKIRELVSNYGISEDKLVKEISKRFNITEEDALYHIEQVKKKKNFFQKRGAKQLRNLAELSVFKTPGINIQIQGKRQQLYKFRMNGVPSELQLFRIIDFINILLYLYVEIYLYKNVKKEYIKNFLKDLTNVASRRNLVEKIEVEEQTKTNIKTLSNIDKERFGFVPEPGKNNYSRNCGKNKQPRAFTNTMDLEKSGYVYNKETDEYTYDITYQKKSKSKPRKVSLRAIKLKKETGENVYYTCHPKINGKSTFIGFLKEDDHPKKMCMPCCFKTDHMYSQSSKIRNRYFLCTGTKLDKEDKRGENIYYILQNTNKMDTGRFGFLSEKLDVWFNRNNNKTMKNNHYLVKTDGYYLKYGINQNNDNFLKAVAYSLNMSVDDLKRKMVYSLTGKLSDSIFSSLDDGNIKTAYKTVDNYVKITLSKMELYKDLLFLFSIPGAVTVEGVNVLIIEKETKNIIMGTEEQYLKKIDDYNIVCENYKNFDKNKNSIIILKENIQFNPIIFLVKKKENKHSVITQFKYEKDNIVDEIYDFYDINCKENIQQLEEKQSVSAIYLKNNLPNGIVKYQILDDYNKCIYLITVDNYILPVESSGCLYDVEIVNNVNRYLKTFRETYNKLMEIYKKSGIPFLPISVIHNKGKTKFIETSNGSFVPIKEEHIKSSKYGGLKIKTKNIIDNVVNKYISRGKESMIVDDRIKVVNLYKYEEDNYQLFKFNMSKYLQNNKNIRKKIIEETKSTKLEKNIMSIIYGKDSFISITKKDVNLQDYFTINRKKNVYKTNEGECTDKYHFKWVKNGCKLVINKKYIRYYVDKLIFELLHNEVSRKEILELDDFYISKVFDYNIFTIRDNEIILNSANPNWNTIVNKLFGDYESVINKVQREKEIYELYESQEMNSKYPLVYRKPFYLQKILPDDNTLYRAYANGIYWYMNIHEENDIKNLGYIHSMQTQLVNYFKGKVINFMVKNVDNENIWKEPFTKMEKVLSKILDKSNYKNITNYKVEVENYVLILSKQTGQFSIGLLDLYVLYKLFKYPIYVYNKFYELIYVIDKNKIIITDDYGGEKVKAIHLKMSFILNSEIPNNIDIMYYDK